MKLFRWILLFALASPLMAQNTRWDLPILTTQAQGGNLLPVYAIPGAGVQFFSCSGSVCTTLATTYISATSSTTCPNSPTPMQVTLNGSSTCVSSADPYGNMGGWFQAGQYMATITASGESYNYFFTISSSFCSSGCTLTGPLSGTSATFTSNVAAPNATIGTDMAGFLIGANFQVPLAAYTFDEYGSGTAALDKSGNGNNCTYASGANAPTQTPYGLLFNGVSNTGQWCNLPATVNANARVYIAYACPQPMTNNGNPGYSTPALAASSSTAGLILGLDGNGTNQPWSWAPSIYGGTGPTFSFATALTGGCHTYAWRIGSNGTTDLDHVYIDGEESAPYSSQGFSLASMGQGTMQLGGSSAVVVGAANTFFSGYMRAFIAYSQALSSDQIAVVSSNLYTIAQRLGIYQNALPNFGVNSPYICLGTSIMYGTGVTNSHCSGALFTPADTIGFSNLGVPGITFRSIAALAKYSAMPLLSANAARNTVFLDNCTNDAAQSVGTAAQCYQEMIATANQLRESAGAIGVKVAIAAQPMLSRTGQATFKNAINALLAQDHSFLDYYVDYRDPLLMADSAYSNSTYFQVDGIHPTQAGQNLMGAYDTAAYNTYWFGTTPSSPTVYTSAAATLLPVDRFVQFNPANDGATITLTSCFGLTLPVTILNMHASFHIVMQAASGQTLTGSPYISGNGTATFYPVSTSQSAGGCAWSASSNSIGVDLNGNMLIGSYATPGYLSQFGNNLVLGSGQCVQWSSTANVFGSNDLYLCRNAAGAMTLGTSNGSGNGLLYANSLSYNGSYNISLPDIPKYCNTVTFAASTSVTASCGWVATTSHCLAIWKGTSLTGGALAANVGSSGIVTVTAATSNSNSAAVYCSSN